MRLSEALRTMKVDRFLHLLPGVERTMQSKDGKGKTRLMVNTNIATFYPRATSSHAGLPAYPQSGSRAHRRASARAVSPRPALAHRLQRRRAHDVSVIGSTQRHLPGAHEVSRFFHAPALMLSPRGDLPFTPGKMRNRRTPASWKTRDGRATHAPSSHASPDEHPFGEGLATIRGAGHWEDARGGSLALSDRSPNVLRLENDAWKITFASIRPS